MISPLKYKPVNWVDGMKLSGAHFTSTDHFIQDFVRDASSIYLNNSNYGLLPPFAGKNSSHDIDIIEKATNHVEVRVRHCNAITAEGCRIDLAGNDLNEHIVYNHYFTPEQMEGALHTSFHVLLVVNPFDRQPAGVPDTAENPPRYPEIRKRYSITVLPAAEISRDTADGFHLTIGKLYLESGRISVDRSYIPPSATIISHPLLIRYYELLNSLINELQQAAFRIIDKTTGKDSITPLGRNIRLLSEKMLDYLAQIFYAYRNVAYQQTPMTVPGYFSTLAHVFFTGVKQIETREREEMLKYFYEWKDVTPGNFEELLARTIELVYDHKDINSAFSMVEEFMRVLVALWNKLSTLEYIGQRRENIVVAEQQMVQQVQTRKTWTLLD
ncbi:hypothetical protein C7T94_12900 [Pedobacter yulinensis]|uniref:Type VI secretion system baseplate subunit TssK n=1 Tax=Pedobacter yulinensis TaxID=2126353 RepID=A0A2T3HLZ1_9SPHI|nr:hypothetical protein [Pedobacter yulinensis]PST83455.1 hypothetical protein C7T94_12900 [Pedobacter yulinensis]